jgi:glycosyltransferase involved in cell wall biosynthesis
MTRGPFTPATPEDPSSLLVDLIIPVLNEAHVLERSVENVRAFLAAHADWRWRVVVVDNGSTDGTDAVARMLVERHDDVRFVQLPVRGRGRALRKAWMTSDADILAYTDVDLSTELAALPKLVDALRHEGFDLGTGSRLLPASQTTRSFKREFISRAYNLLIKLVLRTSFSDAQCGFKVASRAVVQDIVPRIADESWFFDTELLVLAETRGYRIKDLPVRWIEDDDSRVKIVKTAWDDIKGVARLWRTRSRHTLANSPVASAERSRQPSRGDALTDGAAKSLV